MTRDKNAAKAWSSCLVDLRSGLVGEADIDLYQLL